MGLLTDSQYQFIKFAGRHAIEYADAVTGLPLVPDSMDVVYSSHMIEHLDREDARRFLANALKVLRPGGILRLAVPDLGLLVSQYLKSGDADAFMEGSCLCESHPRTLRERLQRWLVGRRHHLWMYDGASLSRRLLEAGFTQVRVVPEGTTGIPDPGPLDLREQAWASVYIEAVKPECESRPRASESST